jgi:hypothetical protein
MKGKTRGWISVNTAATEIAQTLNIAHEAALTLAYGLCALGDIRALDSNREFIELDTPDLAYVAAADVRHHLAEWSSKPQPNHVDAVILEKLRNETPGRSIEWKKFGDDVRDRCNGWRAKGRPAWGFSDKKIQRRVKYLRAF